MAVSVELVRLRRISELPSDLGGVRWVPSERFSARPITMCSEETSRRAPLSLLPGLCTPLRPPCPPAATAPRPPILRRRVAVPYHRMATEETNFENENNGGRTTNWENIPTDGGTEEEATVTAEKWETTEEEEGKQRKKWHQKEEKRQNVPNDRPLCSWEEFEARVQAVRLRPRGRRTSSTNCWGATGGAIGNGCPGAIERKRQHEKSRDDGITTNGRKMGHREGTESPKEVPKLQKCWKCHQMGRKCLHCILTIGTGDPQHSEANQIDRTMPMSDTEDTLAQTNAPKREKGRRHSVLSIRPILRKLTSTASTSETANAETTLPETTTARRRSFFRKSDEDKSQPPTHRRRATEGQKQDERGKAPPPWPPSASTSLLASLAQWADSSALVCEQNLHPTVSLPVGQQRPPRMKSLLGRLLRRHRCPKSTVNEANIDEIGTSETEPKQRHSPPLQQLIRRESPSRKSSSKTELISCRSKQQRLSLMVSEGVNNKNKWHRATQWEQWEPPTGQQVSGIGGRRSCKWKIVILRESIWRLA